MNIVNPGSDQKVTQAQLKSHHLKLLLRAIYSGIANNRAALAQYTNLTKTAVSALISELIEDGYVAEVGIGQLAEGPGKPPRLLEFVPDARQVIGVSISGEQIEGVLTNLDGRIVVYHSHPIERLKGQDVLTLLQDVLNGLVAQLTSPLLSIAIGVEGTVDAQTGTVQHSQGLGWQHLPLAQILSKVYETPVYVVNSTQLAAIAKYAFSNNGKVNSLAIISIKESVGIGLVLNRTGYEHGNDIGYLPYNDTSFGTLLNWSSVCQQVQHLKKQYPTDLLPDKSLNYLHIRYAASKGDRAALALYDELTEPLMKIYTWIIALHRLDHITLVGSIADLGTLLLERITAQIRAIMPQELVDAVSFSLDSSSDLITLGAVGYALRLELGVV